MHKITFSFFVLLLSAAGVFGQQNQLTPDEKAAGWKLLFDGNTTNGWHTYGKETAAKAWVVTEGTLFMDASAKKSLPDSEGGDLVTNEEYENFDLRLEWKIGVKGNSGVIFYIHEDPVKYPDTYETGMEMQVLDNGTPIRRGHDDAKLYMHRAGDLYDMLASKEAVKAQGEWNRIEIISRNGHLDFFINGVHTLTTTMWNDYWKQMIAISKFKDMPGFGTFRKGKISLQEHGEDVWFRNIRIKRL